MTDLPHLIYSHPFDYSTDEVLEWMDNFAAKVERYNLNQKPASSADISISNDFAPVNKYASIWYRKWDQVEKTEQLYQADIEDSAFNEQLPYFNNLIYEEAKIVHDYHYKKNDSDHVLSRFFEVSENKILVLQKAKEAGLDIPTSLITKSKAALSNFYNSCTNGVINKSITDHLMFATGAGQEKGFSNYTEVLTKDFIKQLPDTFGISLFQEKLEKDYEIRTFYLNGACFSMAIFSQANASTQLDSRRHVDGAPNRRTVYQLPKEIELKIDHLMQRMELNTASLDLVKTKDGRCVFLELNPSGQFGMTSYPCNYYLNKLIAEFLCK